jgi:hypothetical protein
VLPSRGQRCGPVIGPCNRAGDCDIHVEMSHRGHVDVACAVHIVHRSVQIALAIVVAFEFHRMALFLLPTSGITLFRTRTVARALHRSVTIREWRAS